MLPSHPITSAPPPPRTPAASIVRRCLLLWVLLTLCPLSGNYVHANETEIDQYKLKAAFIYNFAKYTEWPSEKLETETTPIIIGLSASSPLFGPLQEVLKDRKINGHCLKVVECTNLEQARHVHM